MALQWEPQWEEVLVEKWGIRVKVKRDRVTGLYACPACMGDNTLYFYSVEDLLRHLLTHARREKVETIRVVLEEGEEGRRLEEVGEEA